MKRLKDFRIRFGEGRVSNSKRNHSPLLAPNDKPLQEIEETADHFHHIINKVHHNLKFELEKPEITPSGLSLSLLDFKVTISKDGNSSFEFYKKPAKKPSIRYSHQIQNQIYRNERKRIETDAPHT